MDEDEEILRHFFKEMKDEDANLTVPDYQQKAKSIKWPLIFSVAAFITLAIAFSWALFHNVDPIQEVEIVVEISNSMQTKSLMNRDISLEEWQSPTQSLIDDF